jgi:hypothetical protein
LKSSNQLITTSSRTLLNSLTHLALFKSKLFERGQLDIGDVTERLKGMSQCDGQGPAFKESQVLLIPSIPTPKNINRNRISGTRRKRHHNI